MNEQALANFQLEELQIILEHLQLGVDHLKTQLTPDQFKELENYGLVTQSEKDEFKVTKMEHFFSLSMIYNSIITTSVGAWIGFATLFDMDVTSKLAYVSAFSLLFGGIMGMALLHSNKKQTLQALSLQKIQNFSLTILEFIHRKQKEKLSELIQKLRERYHNICQKEPEKEPPSFDKKEDFFSWFYLFHQAMHLRLNAFPKDVIFQHYREEVLQILKQTEETFITKGELIGNW